LHFKKAGPFAPAFALVILDENNLRKNPLFLPFLEVKNDHFYWLLTLSVRFCPKYALTPIRKIVKIFFVNRPCRLFVTKIQKGGMLSPPFCIKL
jgi:hypothetical protein